ncbi:hypothetical protein [uncultured Bacteroides sp.]|uniref:hypothetical protein n=1 Tax=uncultured Bacteroides sp. TaxID=162156 RepID=UPI002622FB53|nr:hypothetical protein [uncultured Bacteroides sp.]
MIRDCKVVITGGNPQNIDADEIVSIECLPDVRWSWKYNPYNTVLVTSKQRVKICPEDREGLIDAVCKLNPRISVK